METNTKLDLYDNEHFWSTRIFVGGYKTSNLCLYSIIWPAEMRVSVCVCVAHFFLSLDLYAFVYIPIVIS